MLRPSLRSMLAPLAGLLPAVALLFALQSIFESAEPLTEAHALRARIAERLRLGAERLSAGERAPRELWDSVALAQRHAGENDAFEQLEAVVAAERALEAAEAESADNRLAAREALAEALRAFANAEERRLASAAEAAALGLARAESWALGAAALASLVALAVVTLLVRRVALSRELERAAALARVEAEQKAQALFDKAAVGMAQLSLDGQVLLANRHLADALGLSPEELKGKALYALGPADEEPAERRGLERMLEGEIATHSRERRFATAAGASLWMSTSTTLVRGEAGEPLYFVAVLSDVSPRRWAEDAVRKSRDELDAILRGVTDGILAQSPDGQVVYANDAAARLLGFSSAGALLREPLSGAELLANVELWEDSGGPLTIGDLLPVDGVYAPERLVRLRLREGNEERWARVKATVIAGDAGVRFALCFLRDVTEARAAELERTHLLERERTARSEAEASKERYRLLAEAIPQIVWTAEPQGRTDYFNSRWFEYTGLDSVRAADTGWQEVLHPQDVAPWQARWRGAVVRGQAFTLEQRLRRGADGAFRWHLTRAVPMRDEGGRVLKWFGTCTDIDDQKRSEDSLRFLVEASRALAGSLADEQLLLTAASLAVPCLADFCAVDLAQEEKAPQQSAVVHADPSRLPRAQELWRQLRVELDASGEGKVARTAESELVPELDGRTRALVSPKPRGAAALEELGLKSWMVVPLRVGSRTLGTMTLGFVDSRRSFGLSELALAEELARRAALALENARLYREAQVAVRLRDEFLAIVSHELRTPLTAILGYAQMLRAGDLDPRRTTRAMETIERNARAQAQLIEDILDVSRIVTGKLSINRGPVELASVVEASAEAVRPAADGKAVSMSLAAEEGLTVLGDSDRLQQVAWNLLSNAVKFTPRGGRVEVSTRAEGDKAVLEVWDNGRGIRPDFLPHVFDRFRQADSSTTRTEGGLGLGLAIVRHIVELHGGAITVESAGEKQGTRFTVRLPRVELRQASPAGPLEPSPPERLEGVRVLLVDDLPDARELLAEVLQSSGANVVAVSSVSEALAAFEQQLPDVLVSDIGMPGEDGLTLLRRIRALPEERGGAVPAIAVSAYADLDARSRALSSGFQAHVAKPVVPSHLVGAVAKLARERV